MDLLALPPAVDILACEAVAWLEAFSSCFNCKLRNLTSLNTEMRDRRNGRLFMPSRRLGDRRRRCRPGWPHDVNLSELLHSILLPVRIPVIQVLSPAKVFFAR